MKRTWYLMTVLILVALTQAACTQGGCGAAGDVAFVCGPTNAEDLVLVPGTQWIIASGMAAGAGFTAIDSATGEAIPLPVTSGYSSGMYPRACSELPEASEFESHGLDIHAADSGRITLHAVGHGAREAIEIYDVNTAPE